MKFSPLIRKIQSQAKFGLFHPSPAKFSLRSTTTDDFIFKSYPAQRNSRYTYSELTIFVEFLLILSASYFSLLCYNFQKHAAVAT